MHSLGGKGLWVWKLRVLFLLFADNMVSPDHDFRHAPRWLEAMYEETAMRFNSSVSELWGMLLLSPELVLMSSVGVQIFGSLHHG